MSEHAAVTEEHHKLARECRSIDQQEYARQHCILGKDVMDSQEAADLAVAQLLADALKAERERVAVDIATDLEALDNVLVAALAADIRKNYGPALATSGHEANDTDSKGQNVPSRERGGGWQLNVKG